MDKLIGAIVSVLAFSFGVKLLILPMIGGLVLLTGQKFEIWGVPDRLVQIEYFDIQANDHWLVTGYASGILRNDSDKPITSLRITVSYYQCLPSENNQYNMQDLKGCKEIFPDSSIRENEFDLKKDIPPHTSVDFRINHTVGEYYIVTMNKVEPGYVFKMVPQVSRVF